MKKLSFIGLVAVCAALGMGWWLGKSTHDTVLADVPSSTNPVAVHYATTMATGTYEAFFNADPSVKKLDDMFVSAVLPHHLLAGRYVANFLKQVWWQKPSVVVIIGPNHPQAGKNNIVTGIGNWQTPYGELVADESRIQKISNSLVMSTDCPVMTPNGVQPNTNCRSLLAIDDETIGNEHSIGAIVPFIKKTWPNTKIIPIIVKDKTSHAEIDTLLATLNQSLPSDAVVLASVDFSHYLPEPVANFHDEISENVLATGDSSRLSKLEIDSEPSLYFLLEYNKLKQAQNFHLVSHTNSATIGGQADSTETTSHIIGYYTSGAPTEKPLTSLQFFGDIMIDRNVAKNMGGKGLDYVFANLKAQQNRFFKGTDLFIANLEGPFAPSRIQTSKSIAFRFDPKWAPQLAKYNFGVLSLANNHSYDMGQKNIVYTRSLLAKNGIGYFGDQLHEGPIYTWFATSTPETVAFVGVESVTHQPDKAALKKAIDDARAKASYVIVFSHMGTEYKQTSNNEQRALYHWCIDNGADAVIAAHPHVIEETEVYNGKPIFYSLGNFVFDQYFSKETQEGLSVGLTLQGGKVKNAYFFPLYSVNSQDYLMSGERRQEFLDWMGKNSRLEGRQIVNSVLSL